MLNPHDERNTRQCRKCGEVKSVREFPWIKKSGSYERCCYGCKRLRWREWYKPHSREDAWTAEEVAKLRECIDAGMTARESATAIGRSYHATTGQRLRQGFPPFRRARHPSKPRRKWPEERVAQLKRLRDRRIPFSKCAAVLRTTRNAAIGAAYQYLRHAGMR
jgi:hypothetical protein